MAVCSDISLNLWETVCMWISLYVCIVYYCVCGNVCINEKSGRWNVNCYCVVVCLLLFYVIDDILQSNGGIVVPLLTLENLKLCCCSLLVMSVLLLYIVPLVPTVTFLLVMLLGLCVMVCCIVEDLCGRYVFIHSIIDIWRGCWAIIVCVWYYCEMMKSIVTLVLLLLYWLCVPGSVVVLLLTSFVEWHYCWLGIVCYSCYSLLLCRKWDRYSVVVVTIRGKFVVVDSVVVMLLLLLCCITFYIRYSVSLIF